MRNSTPVTAAISTADYYRQHQRQTSLPQTASSSSSMTSSYNDLLKDWKARQLLVPTSNEPRMPLGGYHFPDPSISAPPSTMDTSTTNDASLIDEHELEIAFEQIVNCIDLDGPNSKVQSNRHYAMISPLGVHSQEASMSSMDQGKSDSISLLHHSDWSTPIMQSKLGNGGQTGQAFIPGTHHTSSPSSPIATPTMNIRSDVVPMVTTPLNHKSFLDSDWLHDRVLKDPSMAQVAAGFIRGDVSVASPQCGHHFSMDSNNNVSNKSSPTSIISTDLSIGSSNGDDWFINRLKGTAATTTTTGTGLLPSFVGGNSNSRNNQLNQNLDNFFHARRNFDISLSSTQLKQEIDPNNPFIAKSVIRNSRRHHTGPSASNDGGVFEYDPPGDYVCRLCGVPGHWLKDCSLFEPRHTNIIGESNRSLSMSSSNNDNGNTIGAPHHHHHHHRPSPPNSYVCRLCGIVGHWIEHCPRFEPKSHNITGGISNHGHTVNNGDNHIGIIQNGTTTTAIGNGSQPPKNYICNLCHQSGHWIQQCSLFTPFHRHNCGHQHPSNPKNTIIRHNNQQQSQAQGPIHGQRSHQSHQQQSNQRRQTKSP